MQRLQFHSAGVTWWQKPLVQLDGRFLPAELVVLSLELRPGEAGAWLNSRSTTSGVVDLIEEYGETTGTFSTVRATLPSFVTDILVELYRAADLRKGCPDLVIWNVETSDARLVEVKCPHWDKPSADQQNFMVVAESMRIPVSVVEWEFATIDPRSEG